MPTRRAFTLVELLVVIGIIALLVSILLPALGNARRAAETVKCAAGLREIGNTFRMYALDSRGWFPPSQLQPASGRTYIVDGVSYPTSDGLGAYWFTYLARYATKSKIGSQTSIGSEMADARRSIFWGCPAWLGYYQSSINDTNRNQLGFGMSWWPTFSATNPRIGQFPNVSERSFITNWGNPPSSASPQQGNFITEKTWLRQGSNRILVGDSRFWAIESNPAPAPPNFPPPQSALQNTVMYTTSSGQTTIDVFRHGKYPPKHPTIANTHMATGGKVAYNLLWADGHVTTENDQKAAYLGVRFRFPG